MAMMHEIDNNMKRRLYLEFGIDETDVYGGDMKTIFEEAGFYLIEKYEERLIEYKAKAAEYDNLLKLNESLRQENLKLSGETDDKFQKLKENNRILKVQNLQLLQKLGVLENTKKLDFSTKMQKLKDKLDKVFSDMKFDGLNDDSKKID